MKKCIYRIKKYVVLQSSKKRLKGRILPKKQKLYLQYMLWMNKDALVNLYQTSRQNIGKHIKHI